MLDGPLQLVNVPEAEGKAHNPRKLPMVYALQSVSLPLSINLPSVLEVQYHDSYFVCSTPTESSSDDDFLEVPHGASESEDNWDEFADINGHSEDSDMEVDPATSINKRKDSCNINDEPTAKGGNNESVSKNDNQSSEDEEEEAARSEEDNSDEEES